MAVIEVRGLRKSYDGLEAVRGIDLRVDRGEIVAFLGPNGAGKTSTVEILEGYRHRSAGEVKVLGIDPASATREWRQSVGIVLQTSTVEQELTVEESIDLFAGYYPTPRPVRETIELVGLTDKAASRVSKLSGGQRRRLDVALALIGDPELLFLDEPTTGFDPSARRQAWEMIANLRRLGKTVFLTTHYMDEAQALADRVMIINRGEIVAEGPPAEIGGRHDDEALISFRLGPGSSPGDLPGLGDARVEVADGRVEVRATDPVRALNALTGWAISSGIGLAGLEVRRPSLEDVYLRLTGEPGE
jgi:ABC-2 type transport system ATP-binding protein